MHKPDTIIRTDLGNGYWYDNTPDHIKISLEQVEKIEEKYNAHYVCEWYAGETNNIHLIFWSDVPHPRGSNWMAFYTNQGAMYVKDGIEASHKPINCVVSNSKQVLFSKSRHDFRSSNDRSVSVDGGREYTRVLGNVHCEHVWLVPQQGKLTIIPDAMAHLMLDKYK